MMADLGFLLFSLLAFNTMYAFIVWVAIFMDDDRWWVKLIWIPPLGIIACLLITMVCIILLIKAIFEKLIW